MTETKRMNAQSIEALYLKHGVEPIHEHTLIHGTTEQACVRGILLVEMHGGFEQALAARNWTDFKGIAKYFGLSEQYLAGLEEGYEGWTLGNVEDVQVNPTSDDRELGHGDGEHVRRRVLDALVYG